MRALAGAAAMILVVCAIGVILTFLVYAVAGALAVAGLVLLCRQLGHGRRPAAESGNGRVLRRCAPTANRAHPLDRAGMNDLTSRVNAASVR